MNKLFLIYINHIGEDYKGNYLYEFIFSNTIVDVDGEGWDFYPASRRPQPPNESFIKRVGRLETDLKLDVIQNSDSFAVWDAVDDVIALGWENLDDYDVYPDSRLNFKFGEEMSLVENKLYERDLILNYNIKNYDKQK